MAFAQSCQIFDVSPILSSADLHDEIPAPEDSPAETTSSEVAPVDIVRYSIVNDWSDPRPNHSSYPRSPALDEWSSKGNHGSLETPLYIGLRNQPGRAIFGVQQSVTELVTSTVASNPVKSTFVGITLGTEYSYWLTEHLAGGEELFVYRFLINTFRTIQPIPISEQKKRKHPAIAGTSSTVVHTQKKMRSANSTTTSECDGGQIDCGLDDHDQTRLHTIDQRSTEASLDYHQLIAQISRHMKRQFKWIDSKNRMTRAMAEEVRLGNDDDVLTPNVLDACDMQLGVAAPPA